MDGVPLALLVALSVRWALIEPYMIPSGSMLPSLLVNDYIVVNKQAYGIRIPFTEEWLFTYKGPQRGEVVVFKYPLDMSTFYIKRVVGLPGDVVSVENGILYLNSEPVDQRNPTEAQAKSVWLRDKDFSNVGLGFATVDDYEERIEVLGDGHSVLLPRGDLSYDRFGPVKVPDGHLFVMGDNRFNSQDSRVWSFLPRENLMGRAWAIWLSCEEKLPYLTFLCDPTTIRWTRLFQRVE